MAFFYQDDRLRIGNPTSEISRDVAELLAHPWTRPTYLYDLDDIEHRFHAMQVALKPVKHTIHYAMKANSHRSILRRLGFLGAGADTVSGGEITRAIESGLEPNRIIFSGVGKTSSEIELALGRGIKQINVESPQELERIATIAKQMNRKADVAFRVNPDVNPQTHPYITTGFRENKFGMDESFMPELVRILKKYPDQLRLRGLTMHIGSLLFDLAVIREAIEKTIKIHKQLITEGFNLDRLDIGGGLGIHYDSADSTQELKLIEEYGKMACAMVLDLNVELLVEPGRIFVARSGLLVTEVQYIKPCPTKTFAIVDTGMHHLIRPALYGAKHRVLPLAVRETSPRIHYDIVGPICESSDFLSKGVSLNELRQGDLIGIADAGAYGFAMASRYNSHSMPAELVISGGAIV